MENIGQYPITQCQYRSNPIRVSGNSAELDEEGPPSCYVPLVEHFNCNLSFFVLSLSMSGVVFIYV